MDIIQKLFNEHRGNLISDDENIDIVVANFIQSWTRDELIRLLNDLSDHQLHLLVKHFIKEELEKKMTETDFT